MGFGRSLICTFLVLTILSSYRLVSINGQGLSSGFYWRSCPIAEMTVRAVTRASIQMQPKNAAWLLKLHYSDCFVEGCDGSVLISGPNTERTAEANLNLRGFEVIENIKKQLEVVCPGVVSCADILALAARDAVVFMDGPTWNVPLGRRDGRVSLAGNVINPRSYSTPDLVKYFATFGLNTEELVALIGGHTIGSAACKNVYNRSNIDPRSCVNEDGSNRVPLDRRTPNVFDTSIFNSILNGRGVLEMDHNLLSDSNTKPLLQAFVNRSQFYAKFTGAMIKMSSIGVKTGTDGEIRSSCSVIL